MKRRLAYELRIGNFLLLNNELIMVAAIHKDAGEIHYDIKYYDFTPTGSGKDNFAKDDLVKPIPLDEEWLVKMGFEKDGEGDWQKGDFAFTLGSEGLKLFMEYGFINPPIKFVHQLQNLFFCLTGEELKLTASQSKQQ